MLYRHTYPWCVFDDSTSDFYHFALRFSLMARNRNVLLNLVVHTFRFHQGPEFLVCRSGSALHDIAAEGLQSAENKVGGWMTSFEYEAIGILNSHGTIIWSSLLERFSVSAIRSALKSPRLDMNDAIPMLSFLADFVQSQKDLFDGCKKHGQFKSGTSGYIYIY